MSTVPRRLGSHRFTKSDQDAFIRLSGDANPLHADEVAARRTMFGAPTVHGTHLVLVALEAVIDREPARNAGLAFLTAKYLRPVLIGESVDLLLTDATSAELRITGIVNGVSVFEVSAGLAQRTEYPEQALPPLAPEELQHWSFAELAGASGVLEIGIDAALMRRRFPRLCARLGLRTLAELLALSRMVGMRCPGRHSLSGGFSLRLRHADQLRQFSYRVERLDHRFRSVEIAFEGGRVEGSLRAFYLPSPQGQLPVSAIADFVRPQEFGSSVALVIGGSRGIGETTAKILAAGGARTIVTFHRGAEDAERVADEIRDWGGSCGVEQLDVTRRPQSAFRRIRRRHGHPRSIYYFATPHILGGRRGFFGHDRLAEFIGHYVTGFGALIDEVAAGSARKLRVFYPSSTAVEENSREMAEYVMAKRLGEELCAFYNRYSSTSEIIVERLPPIRTDQTATLMDTTGQESHAVMLPIIRRIELVAAPAQA